MFKDFEEIRTLKVMFEISEVRVIYPDSKLAKLLSWQMPMQRIRIRIHFPLLDPDPGGKNIEK